jgi:hypothetical protein
MEPGSAGYARREREDDDQVNAGQGNGTRPGSTARAVDAGARLDVISAIGPEGPHGPRTGPPVSEEPAA